MIDVEALIREELDHLAPYERTSRDWLDVLSRARSAPLRTRSRSRILIAAPLLAVLILGLALLRSRVLETGHIGVTDRALAAVSSGGPVLHAVLSVDAGRTVITGGGGRTRFTTFDLASGHERSVDSTTEIWFDEARRTIHTKTLIGGGLRWDVLQTPSLTRSNFSRRDRPGSPAVADPALAAFVTGYREALKTGKARIARREAINGGNVIWIRFSGAQGNAEEVAVDATSYRALLLRGICPRCTSTQPIYTIAVLEGVTRDAADFTPPAPPPPPTGRYANSEIRRVSLAETTRLLRARAQWPGNSVRGIKLSLIQFVNSSRHSALPTTRQNAVGRGYGIRFIYGAEVMQNGGYRVPPGAPYVGVSETTSYRSGIGNFNNMNTGFPATLAGAPIPSAPLIALSSSDGAFWTAQFRTGHLYVEVDAPTRGLVIGAAKALRSVPH